MNKLVLLALSLCVSLLFSCQSNNTASENVVQTSDSVTTSAQPAIHEESVNYALNGENFIGFAAYDANKANRPIVMIVPEWWGLNDYAKFRAREIAKLGYTAFAVDMYGNGKIAANPDEAGKLAGAFYDDFARAHRYFNAAVAKAKTLPGADSQKVAAIGYCFGGAMVQNMARMGDALKGVVSFHGNLKGVPVEEGVVKGEMLILHGAADNMVSQAEIDAFKKEMEDKGVKYKFIAYPDAQHAFTNPAATEVGQKYNIPISYNSAADTASWQEMKQFLERVFR